MKAWEDFLSKQEAKLGADNVKRWLKTLKVVRFDACNLYLEASDQFQKNWVEEHLGPDLASLTNNNGHRIKVHLKLEERETRELALKEFCEDLLDPALTYENFIFSKENELLAQLVLDLTGYDHKEKKQNLEKHELGTFNPILLWGPSGSGKTHLLQALAKSFKAKNEKAFFIDAATFANYVVMAIRRGSMRDLRDILRSIDILIVDNIHLLARKTATQEEFFHTFNTLHLNKKQIILSSALAPHEMDEIEKRLVSRFEWGLSLPLKLPSKEIIATVMQKKLKSFGLKMTSEAESFLLVRFGAISSVLKAIEALALRTNEPLLDEESTAIILKDLLLDEEKKAMTAEKIVQQVALHFNLSPGEILGKAQNQECTHPRKIAIYLCRSLLGLPYVKIGNIFGRDHSTVISSFGHIEKALKEKEENITRSVYTILKGL